MKNRKAKRIVLTTLAIVMLFFIRAFTSNSAYIANLINLIDQTANVRIEVNSQEIITVPFDEEIIPYFSYGVIIYIKKPWNYIVGAGDKNFLPTDTEIYYITKSGKEYKAKRFKDPKTDTFLWYMKGVYYQSHNFDVFINSI